MPIPPSLMSTASPHHRAPVQPLRAGHDKQPQRSQPFDRDVEGITRPPARNWPSTRNGKPSAAARATGAMSTGSSSTSQWNQFWNKDQTGQFFSSSPATRLLLRSRARNSRWSRTPSMSTASGASANAFRLLGECRLRHSTTSAWNKFAAGIAVDQSNTLSYFMGDRYIRALSTNEWTVAIDYQLTKKYEIIAAESYDFRPGTTSSLRLPSSAHAPLQHGRHHHLRRQ